MFNLFALFAYRQQTVLKEKFEIDKTLNSLDTSLE